MLVTHDIFTLTVLFIVLLCVAFKGSGKSSKNGEKSVDDLFRNIGENSSEYRRYQEWFEKHQQL